MRLVVALIFLSICSMAYGQAEKPVPPVPRKAETGNKKDKPPATKQEITVTFPPSLNVNLGGKLDVKGEYVQKSANEEPSKWLDPITWFTLILAVANIALWLSTSKAAQAARDAADAAVKQTNYLRRQGRARIALDDIYFRWKTHKDDPQARHLIVGYLGSAYPPRPRIRIKNFGNTTAHHVTVRLNGVLVPVISVDEQMQTTEIKFSGPVYEGEHYIAPRQMLAPTQKYGVWVHLSKGTSFDPHAFYNPNKEQLVIHGAVIYQDSDAIWWLTHFCYVYDGANRFLPYKDYNYEKGYKSEDEAKAALKYV